MLLLLDNESWVVAMVPDQFQAVVDAFVAGNVDQGIFHLIQKITKPVSLTAKPPTNSLASPVQVASLRMGTKSFKVTSSVLMIIKSLYDYLNIPLVIPPLTIDVVAKCVQLLQVLHLPVPYLSIQAFNSRTHKLILGAEVTQLLKIKCINAKILGNWPLHVFLTQQALTSQTISTLIELMPYLRNVLSKMLSSLASSKNQGQHTVLTLVDDIKDNLVEHNQQLVNKFVAILQVILN